MDKLEQFAKLFNQFTLNAQRATASTFEKTALNHFNTLIQAIDFTKRAYSQDQVDCLMNLFILEVALFYKTKEIPVTEKQSYFQQFANLIKSWIKEYKLTFESGFLTLVNLSAQTNHATLDDVIKHYGNSRPSNTYMLIYKDGYNEKIASHRNYYFELHQALMAISILRKINSNCAVKIANFNDKLELEYTANSKWQSHKKKLESIKTVYNTHKDDINNGSLIATTDYLNECLTVYDKISSAPKESNSWFGSILKGRIQNLFTELGLADHLNSTSRHDLSFLLSFDNAFKFTPTYARPALNPSAFQFSAQPPYSGEIPAQQPVQPQPVPQPEPVQLQQQPQVLQVETAQPQPVPQPEPVQPEQHLEEQTSSLQLK